MQTSDEIGSVSNTAEEAQNVIRDVQVTTSTGSGPYEPKITQGQSNFCQIIEFFLFLYRLL